MRGDALRLPDVTADIRIPSEGDREQIARVLATSLHFPLENALARSPTFPLDDMRCAYVDDQVVATAAESPFTQWFGGSVNPNNSVFTSTFNVSGVGSNGTTFRSHDNAHFGFGPGEPFDPGTLVRVAFDKLNCS